MNAILPGSTLGVLGSGHLGRMFAIAARQMGYRVHTFSPDSDTPTGQVADAEVTAAYQDRAGAAGRRRRGTRAGPPGGRGPAHDAEPAAGENVPLEARVARHPLPGG